MRKNVLGLVLGSLVSFSAAAEVKESGFRAGLDLSLSMSSSTGTASPLTRSFGYGMGGQLGYDINRYIGVVGSLSGAAGPKYGDVDVGTSAITLDAIGRIPVSDDFSIYADVGYGRLATRVSLAGYGSSRSRNGMLFGAGIELGSHAQKNGLRLGVETYDTGYTRTTRLLVGPLWKF